MAEIEIGVFLEGIDGADRRAATKPELRYRILDHVSGEDSLRTQS